jgi:DNA-directed RNA polymerase subunit L
MNHISNIKEDNLNLSFELNNNNIIKLSLANAIRRICHAEIPVISIDIYNLIFEENTSMLNNTFLQKRLGLIPFNNNILKNYNIDTLSIYLEKNNDTDHIISIYSGDFIIKSNNDIIENCLVSDKILFAKLKPNQNIKLYGKFKKNNRLNGGTNYSPVSKFVLTYKIDDKKIKEIIHQINDENEKKYFIDTQTEKYYLKTKNNEPAVFILNIESIDIFKPKDIVENSFYILKEKLNFLIQSINENIEQKIKISPSDRFFDSFNFLIFNEDHTLGNLISSYLHDHPNNNYSGYIIVHPNDNKLLITTSMKNDNTLDNNKKMFLLLSNVLSFFIDVVINNLLSLG